MNSVASICLYQLSFKKKKSHAGFGVFYDVSNNRKLYILTKYKTSSSLQFENRFFAYQNCYKYSSLDMELFSHGGGVSG